MHIVPLHIQKEHFQIDKNGRLKQYPHAKLQKRGMHDFSVALQLTNSTIISLVASSSQNIRLH